jgi:hypothetical protein
MDIPQKGVKVTLRGIEQGKSGRTGFVIICIYCMFDERDDWHRSCTKEAKPDGRR